MKRFKPNKTTKEIILGTVIGVGGLTIAYFALWAISKIFMAIHESLKVKVFPWLGSYWWILLIAFVVITIAATVYHNCTNKKTENEQRDVNEDNEEDIEGNQYESI